MFKSEAVGSGGPAAAPGRLRGELRPAPLPARTCGPTPPSSPSSATGGFPRGQALHPSSLWNPAWWLPWKGSTRGIQTHTEGGSRQVPPAGGAGEGASPTAGPRQVIQPGSPGLRPSWCGGRGLGGGAAGGAMGPRLRRGQGALAASSGAGTHVPRTLPTPRRGQPPPSFGVKPWGSWKLGPRDQGAYMRT